MEPSAPGGEAARVLDVMERELAAVPVPRGARTRLVFRRRVAQVDVTGYEARADGREVTLRLFHGAGSAGGSGVACVFVPGRFATSAVFTEDPNRDVRLYLAVHGVNVYSVEYHDEPGAEDFRWGTAACVGGVLTAIAAVREPAVVLVGHSMGAFLSYLAAARCPRRVAGIAALDGGVVGPERGDPGFLRSTARELLAGVAEGEPASARPSVLSGLARRASAGDTRSQRALGRLLTLPSPDRGGRLLGSSQDPAVVTAAAAYLATLTARWSRRQALEARLLALYGPSSWAARDISLLAERRVRVFAALGAAGEAERLRRNEHTARLADAAATVIVRPGYAHLDVLLGPDVHAHVFEPLRSWLPAARMAA